MGFRVDFGHLERDAGTSVHRSQLLLRKSTCTDPRASLESQKPKRTALECNCASLWTRKPENEAKKKTDSCLFPANLAETVLQPYALNYFSYLLPKRSSEVRIRNRLLSRASYSLRGEVEDQRLMRERYNTPDKRAERREMKRKGSIFSA